MHSSVQFTLFSTVKYSFLVIKYQYSYISINNPIQTDYTDSNTYHSKQNKCKTKLMHSSVHFTLFSTVKYSFFSH